MTADPNFSRPVDTKGVPFDQEAAGAPTHEGDPLPGSESTDANPPGAETPTAGSWYDKSVEEDKGEDAE